VLERELRRRLGSFTPDSRDAPCRGVAEAQRRADTAKVMAEAVERHRDHGEPPEARP
jgi:hypothetical protein